MKEYHNKMRKHIMRGIVLLIIAVFCLFFIDSKFYAVACFSFAASQFVFAYSDVKEQSYVDRYGDPTKEGYDAERAERLMEADAKVSAEQKLRRMAESQNEEKAEHAQRILLQDEFNRTQKLSGAQDEKPEVDVDAEFIGVDE